MPPTHGRPHARKSAIFPRPRPGWRADRPVRFVRAAGLRRGSRSVRFTGDVATKTVTITEYIDDLDGSKADRTIAFAFDDVSYEIDLSKRNATGVREGAEAVRGGGAEGSPVLWPCGKPRWRGP